MSNKCHQGNITKKFLLSITTLAVITTAALSLQPAQASLDAAAKATPVPKIKKLKITPTPTLPPPEIFLIRPLSEAFTKIDSIRTTIDLDLAGNLGKKKALKKIAGRLTIDISAAAEKKDSKDKTKSQEGKKSRFTLTGPLAPIMMGDQLGDIPFSEWGFALYRGDHFAWIIKDPPDCFKSKKQISGTEQMEKLYAPDKIIGSLGAKEKGALLAGWKLSEESIEGVETKHYLVDIDSLKKAVKDDKMPDWTRVEVWVAKEGEYLVKISEVSKAKLKLFNGEDYEGAYSVSMLNSNINKSFDIELPKTCDNAKITSGETVVTDGPQAPNVSTGTTLSGTEIITQPTPISATASQSSNPSSNAAKIQLEGSGSQIVDVPEHGPSVVEITFQGSAKDTIYVARLGADNKLLGPLVNIKGQYNGMRPLDLKPDQKTLKFQVQASGKWRMSIVPFGIGTALNVPGQFEGKGNDGIALLTSVAKPGKLKIKGIGDKKPFVVTAYNLDGTSRPIVNAQQAYEGQVDVTEDTVFIDVQASGEWKIEVMPK